MSWIIAATLSAFLFGISGFLLKVGSHKKLSSPIMLLGLYLSGALIIYFGLLKDTAIQINAITITFALIVGMGSYLGNAFLVKAYNTGPASLTAPLVSLNVLLVVLMSSIIYHEEIPLYKFYGISLILIAISLLSFNFKNKLIKSKMWFVFVALTIIFIFMREGGLKISYENGMNNYLILFAAYIIASGLALGNLYLHKRKFPPIYNKTRSLAFGSIIGLFSAVGISLLAYAISKGPASIVIPIFSTRNFVIILLLSIVFKERLSKLQWTSVCILLTGLTIILCP